MLLHSETPPQTTGSIADSKEELAKATQYWGKEYAKKPRSLQAALSYAKDLKALGEKRRALAVLQQASLIHGNSRELANEYGRLALEFDQISLAGRLLAAADDPADPDWRVISARGTVLAKQGKYKEAIPYYEHALALSHDRPSILSNLALAHAMNGEPKRAEKMLRQAAANDRNSLKIRQNLALVLGLQGKYDEAKLLASRDLSSENAAENTDYLRRIVKLEPKKSPASKTTRNIAKAKSSAKVTPVAARDDDETDSKAETAQTSEESGKAHGTKMTANASEILRGPISPAEPEPKSEIAQKTQAAPSSDTSFSVAQWAPQTHPAPIEAAAKEPKEPVAANTANAK